MSGEKDLYKRQVQVMTGSELRKNWYDAIAINAYGYDPKTLTTKPIIFIRWSKTPAKKPKRPSAENQHISKPLFVASISLK